MPVGEIAGGALGGIARLVGYFFVELIFEVLIQGAGHVILRTLRPGREPGEIESAVVGLAMWAAIVGAGSWLFRHAAG